MQCLGPVRSSCAAAQQDEVSFDRDRPVSRNACVIRGARSVLLAGELSMTDMSVRADKVNQLVQ